MYTILVNQDNTMITSVRERIMQRSKLVDSLHFLVDPIYKGLDMSDFTVIMEYILPVSKKYITEILIKSNEPYNSKINKEMLEYTLPFDTKLTREPGDIKVQLTFTKVDLDEYGNNRQYVRKISETTIHITPIINLNLNQIYYCYCFLSTILYHQLIYYLPLPVFFFSFLQ